MKANGDDPLAYQRDKERELQPFRDSSWAGATGLRRIDVGQQAMAEGQFTWQDSNGREVYVRNLALIVDGSYHVIQVIGPEDRARQGDGGLPAGHDRLPRHPLDTWTPCRTTR